MIQSTDIYELIEGENSFVNQKYSNSYANR